MPKSCVFLKDLANELGVDRSFFRRYVLKLGVKPHKQRLPDLGNQPALAVTEGEAEFIRTRRVEEGYNCSGKPITRESGFFYVIRLVPELDPGRVKLGFAEDVTGRLAQHRTAAPTAAVVKSWPCRRAWELTVTDVLVHSGCKRIANEVFECDDVDALTRTADRLFNLLPPPDSRPALSEHSPHNT